MNNNVKREKLWQLIGEYRGFDKQSLLESIGNHMEFSLCQNRYTYNDFDIYESLALSIRDRLIEFWNDTQQTYYDLDPKRVYYLSLEFLMGRSLRNNLINLGIYENVKEAMIDIGYELEDLEEMEHDAGLGNGGLGRLAACFVDSMASLQLPAIGYGIRYEYGIFEQKIENGQQVEHPDNWLREGHAWEVARYEYQFPIDFYGHVHSWTDNKGRMHFEWKDTYRLYAMAYDVPVPGYQNRTVNNLRLWSAQASKDFHFDLFNSGDYIRAVEDQQKSEMISKVLYPNDKGFSGKELRLKQQYFFVAASLHDIMRRYKRNHTTLDQLPEKVAIQLNDTHPSVAIPELMRILMDIENLEWEPAWAMTTKIFAYTNHTVLPEALEKWPMDIFGNLLPRHLQIIFEINRRFLEEVKIKRPDDKDLLNRVSLIEEGDVKQIRMPYLAIVGSHTVNGVAFLHSELLKETIFKDFYELFPNKFINKTNGITPRRWLKSSNTVLSDMITRHIGEGWVTNLDKLKELVRYADDTSFQKEWWEIKRKNKARLAEWIRKKNNIHVSLDSMFDVQVKRIHEYKRQLLNIMHVITLYRRIKKNPKYQTTPRTVIYGGKAAPGYFMAKKIIHLANDVARVVNSDNDIGDRLKVVFLENFGVSLGEKVYPAAELNEQISTAGTEASGTGNMKFCLNGGLIIGTLDGATIEIKDCVGEDNIFIFGLTTPQVQELKRSGYQPRWYAQANPELNDVLEMINNGYFNPEDSGRYQDIYNSLIYDDNYLLLADFQSYIECQERVSKVYANQDQWTKMSILNTANMGFFSSDRSIAEYAKEIWGVEKLPIEPLVQKVR